MRRVLAGCRHEGCSLHSIHASLEGAREAMRLKAEEEDGTRASSNAKDRLKGVEGLVWHQISEDKWGQFWTNEDPDANPDAHGDLMIVKEWEVLP